jgi:site-specific recombinase XerD
MRDEVTRFLENGVVDNSQSVLFMGLEQIQFLLGHISVQTTERYLECK